jgi:hypothetical protein
MNGCRILCLMAAVLLTAARADTVTLDNGKVLEGRVTDNGATITVELAHGTVRLHKARVKSIATKATPQDDFARRAAAIEAELAAGDVDQTAAADRFYTLAQWADANSLSHARTQALAKALELDPDHEGAREDSGYVLHEGRWMKRAERNQKLGFVRLEGQWVPKEAAADAKRARDGAADQRDAETAPQVAETRPAPSVLPEYDDGRLNRYLRTRPPTYGPYLSVNRVTLGDPPYFWPMTPAYLWSVLPAPNVLVTNRPPATPVSGQQPKTRKPAATLTPRPDPTRPPFLPAQ